MSHTTEDASTTPKKKKMNPATMPREELLERLSTDPGTGLSPKEAARRRDKSLSGALYAAPMRSASVCILSVVREVALWLLVAVSVFALFFDRVLLGLVCLALTIGHAVFCAVLTHRNERTDSAMQAMDAPLTRVLRGGRVRRIGADTLVPGDILLLHPGDLVPADARLLRTDALVVSERPFVSGGKHAQMPPERLEKDADARPTGPVRHHSPVNMVFAGGVVEAGFAVAVVVAVGQNTHLGGLIGHVAPAHPSRMPSVLRAASRPLSVINLILVALVIPLTVIGIFTLRDRYELLDIVLSALSLATLTLTEQMLIKGRAMAAVHRRDAATARDAVNTVDIKSAADLEKLTVLDDLLLVGTAALHDGTPYPETVRIGTTTYRCDRPDADDAVRALVELITLYADPPVDVIDLDRSAQNPEVMARLRTLLPRLVEWSEMDREAFRLKAKDVRCEGGCVSAVLPTVEGNRRVGVILTDRFEDLYSCDDCFTAGPLRTAGREVAPDVRPSPADERLEELHRVYRAACRGGASAFFVITVISGRRTVHAMVTYSPVVCPKTAGAIRSMEAAGVRVSAYVRRVSAENLRVLTACGLADQGGTDRPVAAPDSSGEASRAPVIERLQSGCRAFEGCTTDSIRDAIRDLRAAGRTVAVLSVEAGDQVLFDEADLAVTCSPSVFLSAEADETRIPTAEAATARNPHAGRDGTPTSELATDLCRRRADIWVRRATTTGGGIYGFRQALLTADRYKAALDRFYTYLLSVQILRLAMTLVPLCLGLAPASAVALLVSGFVGDVVAYQTILHLPPASTPAARRSMAKGLGDPWRTHKSTIIATVVAGVLPWMIAGIARLAGASFGGDPTLYGLLCLLGAQAVLFSTDRLPRRDRVAFFGILGFVLLYIGAVAWVLAAGLSWLWVLVVPTAVNLGFGIVMCALRRSVSKLNQAKNE